MAVSLFPPKASTSPRIPLMWEAREPGGGTDKRWNLSREEGGKGERPKKAHR